MSGDISLYDLNCQLIHFLFLSLDDVFKLVAQLAPFAGSQDRKNDIILNNFVSRVQTFLDLFDFSRLFFHNLLMLADALLKLIVFMLFLLDDYFQLNQFFVYHCPTILRLVQFAYFLL